MGEEYMRDLQPTIDTKFKVCVVFVHTVFRKFAELRDFVE